MMAFTGWADPSPAVSALAPIRTAVGTMGEGRNRAAMPSQGSKIGRLGKEYDGCFLAGGP